MDKEKTIDKEALRKLEQEKKELNVLINRGAPLEIKDVEIVTIRKFFFFKKHIKKEVTRKFSIQQPTLATLDRLSREWIEMAIDETKIKSMDGMRIARELAHNHAIRCAKVIAIAVLGEDRLIAKPGNGCTRWIEDTKKLEELTDLFARKITPSRLLQLVNIIAVMCNLADFTNSIRLMSSERSTLPVEIEEENVA